MRQDVKALVNGIDARTGKLLIEPIAAVELEKMLQKRLLEKQKEMVPLYGGSGRLSQQRAFVEAWHLPKLEEPGESGWGAVIHKDDRRLGEVLKPLIEHRNGEIFYYDGNENAEKWIGKHFLGRELPYYLMIAGAPERISFAFQYMLDVRFAVGRLSFEDEKSYENYCGGVIAREKGEAPRNEKRMIVCATDWGYEDPTFLSRKFMAEPLAELGAKQGFTVERLMGEAATEENLKRAVCGEKRPAMVYTASHGAGWDRKDPKQRFIQGGICCQDQPGKAPLEGESDGLLTGCDVDNGFDASGAIWFCFACYGAGTPKYSDFFHWAPKAGYPLHEAERDFVSYLPMRLLGCDKPALGFIGHVDPAWVLSFMEPSDQPPEDWTRRLFPYRNAVEWILNGVPMGHAMKTFNETGAALGSWLMHLMVDYEYEILRGETPSKELIDKNPFWLGSLTDLWITRTDCQNYIVLGDPAVRIGV